MGRHKLLLVDDDPFILEGIGEELERNGYHVTRAADGESAVDLLESARFDLVITDLVMGTTDGNCLEKQELTRRINLYQKILPMCCVCKKIRDDSGSRPGDGEWISIEQFIHEQADLDITSSYCPDCAQKTMDEYTRKNR